MKIAIASGKGGTGKTFVATNIFYALLKNNHSVVLVDCDAEAPDSIGFFRTKIENSFDVVQKVPVIDLNSCTYCSKCKDYCNYNAIFILPPIKFIQVIEELCHGCGACSVACTFGAIKEKPVSLGKVNTYILNGKNQLIEACMNIGVMSPVQIIKAAIKEIDYKYDIAVLDSPPGTSCPFIHTTAAADFVILVTEPTPFGLSDLKQSVETLKEMNKKYGVIINRAGLGNNDVYKYIENENIPLLLEIPFDKEIAALYSAGIIVSEYYSEIRKKFYEMIKKIMEQYGNCGD